MNERSIDRPVGKSRRVACAGREDITPDHCRLCVHSRAFVVGGKRIASPARVYCLRCRPPEEELDLGRVEAVECDDLAGEGFRSITNIIS